MNEETPPNLKCTLWLALCDVVQSFYVRMKAFRQNMLSADRIQQDEEYFRDEIREYQMIQEEYLRMHTQAKVCWVWL